VEVGNLAHRKVQGGRSDDDNSLLNQLPLELVIKYPWTFELLPIKKNLYETSKTYQFSSFMKDNWNEKIIQPCSPTLPNPPIVDPSFLPKSLEWCFPNEYESLLIGNPSLVNVENYALKTSSLSPITESFLDEKRRLLKEVQAHKKQENSAILNNFILIDDDDDENFNLEKLINAEKNIKGKISNDIS